MNALGIPDSVYKKYDNEPHFCYINPDRTDFWWVFRLLLPTSLVTTPFWLNVSPLNSETAFLT